jgi:predicted unusual protein kinase regulating ubiquinone biosynthesis (AarF/ABC1/UbiB family)
MGEINPPADQERLVVTQSQLRRRYRRLMGFFLPLAVRIFFWDVFLHIIGLNRLARRNRSARYSRAAERFRELAVELGGVWIKVGQFLSARLDILPDSIIKQLAGLQDEVAPEPFDHIEVMIEQAFDRPAEAVFAHLDSRPLAAASLGQVHRARLHSGEAVVVKVQRPDIDHIIRVDLSALQRVVGWLKRYRPISRRADLDALYDEFSRTLWQEVDYLAEAEHARQFKAIFEDDPDVRVPEVYSEYTTLRVLTLEDVYFIKITDYAAIEAAGVDRSEVADRLFDTYLRQIFVVGFFHADPHPGNLFVQPLDDGGWRLVFVDFGMVGYLTEDAKQGLRELAIAVGTRDLDRLIGAYQQLGVLLPSANLDRIKEAESVMLERFWGKSMQELTRIDPREFHDIAKQFRDIFYEMPFQAPSDLIFLVRCVAILSGMCTGLDPEFNIFLSLTPFAQKLLAEDGGDWLDIALEWLTEQGGSLLKLPARLDGALGKIESGQLVVTAQAGASFQMQIDALRRSVNRLGRTVAFSAFLLAAAYLYVNGEVELSAAAMVLSLVMLALSLRR